MKLTASAAGLILLVVLSISINRSIHAQKKKPEQPTVAETADEIIRVSTALVILPVRVLDRHGKLIADLKQQEFHVFEDGVEQQIAYFEPPTVGNDSAAASPHKPFTVALLLDVSDSTEFQLKQIQSAALTFLDLLRPEDRVILVVFDKRVQVLADATSDRQLLREKIRHTRTGGGTSLYAALDVVITQHLSHVVGRKAIVLLTDGVDTASAGATADSTLRAAQESDAAIYPIQYDTYGDFADSPSREINRSGDFGAIAHQTKNGEPASEAYKRATLYLRLLADKTSGTFQYTDSVKNLSRSFESIAAELRRQYTIGYYPKNKAVEGAEKIVKVEVGVPKVTVRTRKSYIYKSKN